MKAYDRGSVEDARKLMPSGTIETTVKTKDSELVLFTCIPLNDEDKQVFSEFTNKEILTWWGHDN